MSKKMKQMIEFLLQSFLVFVLFLGGVQAAAPKATLAAIKERGTIRLGNWPGSVPFSDLDAQKRPNGYSTDICNRIVDMLSAKIGKPIQIEWVQVGSKTRFTYLDSGQIDMECAASTITRERLQKYAFSHSMYVAGNRLLSKKSSNLRTWEDLQGKKIAVVTTTTGESLVQDLNKRLDKPVELVVVKNLQEAWEALNADKVDAVGYDDVLLQELAADSKLGGDAYQFVGGYLSVEPYGMLIRKDDPEFLKALNNAMDTLFESREIYKIYAKWFLNGKRKVPMSQFLKEDIMRPNSYPAYP